VTNLNAKPSLFKANNLVRSEFKFIFLASLMTIVSRYTTSCANGHVQFHILYLSPPLYDFLQWPINFLLHQTHRPAVTPVR